MSELSQAGVVILLTLAGVVFINAIILIALRRKRPGSEVEVMRRLGNAAKQPFEKDDAQFEELSRLVKNLRTTEPSVRSTDVPDTPAIEE